MKVRLHIDHRLVEADSDAVLIDVMRREGIRVPSMCYLEGMEHNTSCMLCVVKDRRSGKIIPSCSLKAEEGMDIISLDDEVQDARKMALDLLLSEHVGDCEAPCQVTCPAHMDIPLMNRLLADGKFREALQVVKKDIALPSVLGRICPAPCEGACRRRPVDQAVSICLLKRFAGDKDLEGDSPWLPEKAPDTGRRVTIIGAGPAGLAAAYHLALKGHRCTVIDRHPEAGGSLLMETTPEELPREVLRRETGLIGSLGVTFRMNRSVDADGFRELAGSSDAVVVAVGKEESGIEEWGLRMHAKGVEADPRTYRVGESRVFVVGSALKPSKMAIRALGQGKEVSFSVDQLLRGEPVTGEKFMFNSRFGKLFPDEYGEYLKESVEGGRLEPESMAEGLTAGQVMEEARRCMHCDCRKINDCKLRSYSDLYGADQKRFAFGERVRCVKVDQHEKVIYEPSKCIKCGVCVRITEKYREELGLTFIGRGFEVAIGVPFNESLASGLKVAAVEAAEACPTGALSLKADFRGSPGSTRTVSPENPGSARAVSPGSPGSTRTATPGSPGSARALSPEPNRREAEDPHPQYEAGGPGTVNEPEDPRKQAE
jgi:ferredoxin